MYRDKSLIPAEAIRLLALGLLAEAPRSYADLASEVRRVTGLLVGPSLDMLAPPLELLRIEGLVGEKDDRLTLTRVGRQEFERLMMTPLRQAASDLYRLVVALKLRFLSQLSKAEQAIQLAALTEAAEREGARLAALADGNGEAGLFDAWLALERTQAEARLAWLKDKTDKI